ncbi:iron-containing alcohol dehydrogenase [Marinococcus sp. PL1-022]|uniref:iron-containing alcohol dehydrogenase n=1 Tax=Marinococcus sp. PL1-022 TaxID=3095363 RepID=UPI0029C569DE|nr:iron-containing alcohol dehydrogenase [Marinococcus sp. PL1-022]MDX6152252.1 iron-containing alcohol dehydrogenase [Marinococcus sp. PL1-022]
MNIPTAFQSPAIIHYGKGSFQQVGKETIRKGKKALIISDQMMEKLGYIEKCRTYLQEENVESFVYNGVGSEPTDKFVEEALHFFHREECDVILSIGGGSCIDTAKSVAVLSTNGGYIGDYMGGKKQASHLPSPHIAIPTTAGTGSEATDVTIITNTANEVKMMIKQPAFLPEAAIIDPELSKSAPAKVKAATGVDALSHAIEAYISQKAHPLSDMMALSAMKLIVPNLQKTYNNSEDVEAQEKMALGALQAGWAFSNSSVCLVHGMSRPIGALFHVPHGFSNAMLLPAVMEFSREAAIKRLADLGRIFEPEAEKYTNEEAADIAISSVKALCRNLQIPNLQEWGIEQKEFESAIDKMAKDAFESGSPEKNPKVPSKEEMKELYRICYNYNYAEEIVR